MIDDFRVRKPRRDIDIYDYYFGDSKEEKSHDKSGSKCPWCGGTVSRESSSSKYYVCDKCGRRI